MIKKINRKAAVRKRHYRLRRKLSGTAECPRLAVHRSGSHIYVQVIDDLMARTLVSASTVEKEMRSQFKHGGNIEAAKAVGALVASRAKEKGIQSVVFDRGGHLYHGRVAALANAAREGGLVF